MTDVKDGKKDGNNSKKDGGDGNRNDAIYDCFFFGEIGGDAFAKLDYQAGCFEDGSGADPSLHFGEEIEVQLRKKETEESEDHGDT